MKTYTVKTPFGQEFKAKKVEAQYCANGSYFGEYYVPICEGWGPSGPPALFTRKISQEERNMVLQFVQNCTVTESSNAITITSEELDKIALDGTPVMGWDIEDIDSEDYETRATPTGVALVGKTPRGKRLVKIGKETRLKRDGCPAEIAKHACYMPYGMKESVWKLVEEWLLPLAKRGIGIKFQNVAQFLRATGIKNTALSLREVQAAAAIAERVLTQLGSGNIAYEHKR